MNSNKNFINKIIIKKTLMYWYYELAVPYMEDLYGILKNQYKILGNIKNLKNFLLPSVL